MIVNVRLQGLSSLSVRIRDAVGVGQGLKNWLTYAQPFLPLRMCLWFCSTQETSSENGQVPVNLMAQTALQL